MTKPLSLYYPAKPYQVTQAFGILNPSYEQFGFKRHNGIDFRIDTDGIVRAMCDGLVYDVGFNNGAGNYVRYHTTLVEAEGREGVVGLMYMHAKECLVKPGQVIHAGDALIVADNTGFSTGPHTHISAYFVDPKNVKVDIGLPDTDNCFDFSKYYNGLYSDDVILSLYNQTLSLAQKLLTLIFRR